MEVWGLGIHDNSIMHYFNYSFLCFLTTKASKAANRLRSAPRVCTLVLFISLCVCLSVRSSDSANLHTHGIRHPTTGTNGLSATCLSISKGCFLLKCPVRKLGHDVLTQSCRQR